VLFGQTILRGIKKVDEGLEFRMICRLLQAIFFVGGLALLIMTGIALVARSDEPQPEWLYYSSYNAIYRIRPNGEDLEELFFSQLGTEINVEFGPKNQMLITILNPHEGNFYLYVLENERRLPQSLENPALNGWANEWLPIGTQFIATEYHAHNRNEDINDLFLVDTENQQSRLLTPNTENYISSVGLSEDKRHYIFSLREGNNDNLFSITLDTGSLRPITDFSESQRISNYVQFHQWIVFSLEKDNRKTIYRVRDDGTGLQPIFGPTTARLQSVRWQSDGEWLLFHSDMEGMFDLYRMRPDGSELQKLTDSRFRYTSPEWWNTNDEWILYGVSGENGSPQSLLRMRPNGTEKDVLVPADPSISSVGDVYWSPDRKWLAYGVYTVDSTKNLFIRNMQTGEIVQVPDTPIIAFWNTWSPDSNWLIYTINFGIDEMQLFRIHPDGSDREALTQAGIDVSFETYSPIVDFQWNSTLLLVIGIGLVGRSLCLAYFNSRTNLS
jgi:Tol biopolymer transport system component